MKIGIYGGSFNPIHKGHIQIINSAFAEYQLDCIYLVPSYISPNKVGQSIVDSSHRINMCEIAAKDISNLYVSDYETNNSEVSYTYKTISHFKSLYPSDELFFLMGADSLDYFDEWKHPEIITKYSNILVLMRDGFLDTDMELISAHISNSYHTKVNLLKGNRYNASSSDIRRSLENCRNICPDSLDENVYSYIIEHNLY